MSKINHYLVTARELIESFVMKEKNEVFELSLVTPFSALEIEPIYWRCRSLYWPNEKATEKCLTILNTASEFAISPIDAFYIQFEIDFCLL